MSFDLVSISAVTELRLRGVVRDLYYCYIHDPYWACLGLRALLYLGLCAHVVLT
jgi:hypothetical protein